MRQQLIELILLFFLLVAVFLMAGQAQENNELRSKLAVCEVASK